ncbi:hypothetical protein [Yersinia ruckeri]|uniref:hypothetical protein n=1 Tax=Yersinia ruckeri TaxID=29486 RepID=UPI000A79E6F7|nr:hypothetical protein [Yersinia ruckeri]EKN4199152.1 hypothetical protein [Yersinia ruckeri]EKN4205611.1 hypothetical protein [Yersinia ruckeri]EKN4703670.1 hypothetical protein [Yersinia ruckeri]ELI6452924.1 hypothetical protein [Yersinia ruckeri]MCK8595915.1 hypothetical protein [Yersinia ruckeri]
MNTSLSARSAPSLARTLDSSTGLPHQRSQDRGLSAVCGGDTPPFLQQHIVAYQSVVCVHRG